MLIVLDIDIKSITTHSIANILFISFVQLNCCLKGILIDLVHDFSSPDVVLNVSALSGYDPHIPWHSAPSPIEP